VRGHTFTRRGAARLDRRQLRRHKSAADVAHRRSPAPGRGDDLITVNRERAGYPKVPAPINSAEV
jgi:hypothetical protein